MVGQLQAPIDYFSTLAPFDIGQDMRAHQLQTQQDALLQTQQQRAVQQQAQLDQARAAFAKDPSAQNFSALVTYDPKSYEAIKSAHDAMDVDERNNSIKEQTAIHGYLAAGRAKEAKALLDRRIAADKAAGLDTADDQEFSDLIGEDPEAAKATVAYHLGSAVGADKFGEVFGKVGDSTRADAKLPVDIAKTTADTTKTLAETNQIAPNAEAERNLKAASVAKMAADVDNAAARLGLDRDRLQADIDIKTRELDLKEGDLPDGARAAVNNAVTASVGSRQLANRAGTLADQFQSAPNVGGKTGATWANWYTAATGDASAVTALRREYTQLRAQQAVKNLPPGPASDKDIQLALKGFPSDTDSRETLVSFLRGMQKLNDAVAEQQDRQADWLAYNKGSLGPARSGFFVGNTYVAPGTKFDDVEKRVRLERAKAAAAARVAK